jgi:hypothetical protein
MVNLLLIPELFSVILVFYILIILFNSFQFVSIRLYLFFPVKGFPGGVNCTGSRSDLEIF